MISADEAKRLAIQHGVPLPYIEKDYVMGWLLWGIYHEPSLANTLVLKGGNCLRKVYFSDTRFSDDLDFTALKLDPERVFEDRLKSICDAVERASGIVFDIDRTKVEAKSTPDKDAQALDGRVYFRGFAGDSRVSMRIKLDVSNYEQIVLPPQRHPILHQCSDVEDCRATLFTYSLEEVLAEKLRSWIQRTRSRDLFDAVKIIQSGAVPISKRNILSAFLLKTIFKQIPIVGRDEMLFEPKFTRISEDWDRTIICPPAAVMAAATAIVFFKECISGLFDTSLLQAVGVSAIPSRRYSYNIGSDVREAIIQAGKARQLMRMKYDGKDRDIEPYSFRYKVTREGYGAEYFYGFDRTRGQTIKMFFLYEIQSISILPHQYIPRWVVEFS